MQEDNIRTAPQKRNSARSGLLASPRRARRKSQRDDESFEAMFELAPVSLWLEDYSLVRALFEQWAAAGITDLRAHLLGNPTRVAECSARIRVLKVNRRTLELYGATDQQHLVDNLARVFRDDMFDQHAEELIQLHESQRGFSNETVNYTLAGRRIDISLHGSVLPGHEDTWNRVLVAIEDVTERVRTERNLARSEQYARGLFNHSPVSLWVEDFSGVKARLDEVRALGITDFRTFIDVHPEFVVRCMREIRVMDVNEQTVAMFGSSDKPTLLSRLDEVFRDEMRPHFAEQLIDLWNGHLFQQREVVNYSLSGDRVNVYMQLSVLPGYEDTWELVQISLTDITARKKAEAYLEYLGKHDVMTQLANRSYFEEEMTRLEKTGPYPVTIIVADLNGLKVTNDDMGHAAGDALLRRAAEVLKKAVGEQITAARIGGDEFCVLMAATDERTSDRVVSRIESLIDLNNQYYQGARLSLSLGAATCAQGDRLEQTMSLADERMYAAKKEYYARTARNRRKDY